MPCFVSHFITTFLPTGSTAQAITQENPRRIHLIFGTTGLTGRARVTRICNLGNVTVIINDLDIPCHNNLLFIRQEYLYIQTSSVSVANSINYYRHLQETAPPCG